MSARLEGRRADGERCRIGLNLGVLYRFVASWAPMLGAMTNPCRRALFVEVVTLCSAAALAAGCSARVADARTADGESFLRSLHVENVSALENERELRFVLSLTTPPTEPTQLRYALQSQTALAGSDFVDTSSNLSLRTGQTRAEITVPLLDDDLYEGTETFKLALFASNQLAEELLTATATLEDNESEPFAIVNNPTANERDCVLTFNITLSGPYGRDVGIHVGTEDGSALSGADYDVVAGTVVVPAGEIESTVYVRLIDDNLRESEETLVLLLSEESGTLHLPSTATGTIVDDDRGEGSRTVSDLYAGWWQSCAIVSGELYCWGSSRDGILGIDETVAALHTPTRVGAESDWVGIGGNSFHTCGLRSDHSFWCWGRGAFGQLGLGDTTNRYVPERVTTDHFVGVSQHSNEGNWDAAVKDDGTLWVWGQRGLHLGTGDSRTGLLSPTRITSFDDFVMVDVGGDTSDDGGHACALREDHSLWCWGTGRFGQLGDGTSSDRATPTQTVPGSTWSYVSVGEGHACALDNEQHVWCWGLNSSGESGVGDTAAWHYSPVEVSPDTEWDVLSAGMNHNCAINTDGELYCWGYNTHAQLGDGTTDYRTLPVQITTDHWVDVSAGGNHTCAAKDDNSVWCWGINTSAQCGDTVDILNAKLVPYEVIAGVPVVADEPAIDCPAVPAPEDDISID